MATSALTLLGSSTVEVDGYGGGQMFLVPFSCTLGTYATGGATITLPTSDIQGMVLKQVMLNTRSDGTRFFDWDGNQSTPKIKSYSAIGTETVNATDLSAVTVRGILLYTTGE